MVTELHKLFNEQRRYFFPFNLSKKEIPKNGIYILFEKGEKFGNYDRIVRVGTHTGKNQLHSRLIQHFIKENKNRSIFRKNVGRCFLYKENNPYLELWELDITSEAEKEKNLRLLDLDFEKQMEKRISNYIQASFTFCTFQVDTKEKRLFWEGRIASTLAQTNDLRPSSNWLGNFSPKEKIKKYGLWQVNELNKGCLTKSEFHELRNIVVGRIPAANKRLAMPADETQH